MNCCDLLISCSRTPEWDACWLAPPAETEFVGWIPVKFATDVYVHQRMDCDNNGDEGDAKYPHPIPASLDPHQHAFRTNRSTEDAISTALHSVFTHPENKNSYVGMLLLDFSSAFNTISPMKLIGKLNTLGISASVCSWILDFLTCRPQRGRLGSHTFLGLAQHRSPPELCAQPPYCSHCTPMTAPPDIQRTLLQSAHTATPSSAGD